MASACSSEARPEREVAGQGRSVHTSLEASSRVPPSAWLPEPVTPSARTHVPCCHSNLCMCTPEHKGGPEPRHAQRLTGRAARARPGPQSTPRVPAHGDADGSRLGRYTRLCAGPLPAAEGRAAPSSELSDLHGRPPPSLCGGRSGSVDCPWPCALRPRRPLGWALSPSPDEASWGLASAEPGGRLEKGVPLGRNYDF